MIEDYTQIPCGSYSLTNRKKKFLFTKENYNDAFHTVFVNWVWTSYLRVFGPGSPASFIKLFRAALDAVPVKI